jgi:cation diffusion facilitator CzcD-associated flavoprotein CzcO
VAQASGAVRDRGLRAGRDVDTSVVIVGAGFSGIGMAIKLKQAGVDDFVVLEKASRVGGTWRDNQYPGCACDVPSFMYSFSYALNPDWTRMFATQPEIWAYLERCIERYDLARHIRFGTEFGGAEFDDATATWRVLLKDGQLTSRALVLGTGPLHIPRYPEIPGAETFTGATFHSATWDHSLDLAGKRVAVIGTGASAIQFVPQIAPRVAALELFQRTPPWVLPKPDREISARERDLFRRHPGRQRARRWLVYWGLEARLLGFTANRGGLNLAERMARRHIAKGVADPEVRRKVTPDYAVGCKRVLISDDYYPALNRDNVHLRTEAITRIEPTGVRTADGRLHEVDVIVYGTGFHVTDAFDDTHLVGRDGLKLQDAWHDGVEAYLGTAISGFPNAFVLLGPNSALGHNSVVFMAEQQIKWIVRALRLLARRQASSIEVLPGVQRRYNEQLQRDLSGSVWNAGGCTSWYLDRHGVNRTLWPTFTWRYWLRMRKLDPADFAVRR